MFMRSIRKFTLHSIKSDKFKLMLKYADNMFYVIVVNNKRMIICSIPLTKLM